VGYDTDVVTYISAGFDILIVNYRGSTGFGQGK
jgi:dipeptidyl aminopeptidase/acylaminoacyl peptidase